MVRWHHQLNGHELEQVLGDGKGRGSLICCNPRGHKNSDTNEQLKNNYVPETLWFWHIEVLWRCTIAHFLKKYVFLATPHGMLDLSTLTRDKACVPCIWKQSLNHWTTRKVPNYPLLSLINYVQRTSEAPTWSRPGFHGVWSVLQLESLLN